MVAGCFLNNWSCSLKAWPDLVPPFVISPVWKPYSTRTVPPFRSCSASISATPTSTSAIRVHVIFLQSCTFRWNPCKSLLSNWQEISPAESLQSAMVSHVGFVSYKKRPLLVGKCWAGKVPRAKKSCNSRPSTFTVATTAALLTLLPTFYVPLPCYLIPMGSSLAALHLSGPIFLPSRVRPSVPTRLWATSEIVRSYNSCGALQYTRTYRSTREKVRRSEASSGKRKRKPICTAFLTGMDKLQGESLFRYFPVVALGRSYRRSACLGEARRIYRSLASYILYSLVGCPHVGWTRKSFSWWDSRRPVGNKMAG